MPRTRPAHDEELRQKILDLVRAGHTVSSPSREFGPTQTTIRNWVAQTDRDVDTRSDGQITDERTELAQLRREFKARRVEREIPKKAAAWFAPKTGATSRRPLCT